MKTSVVEKVRRKINKLKPKVDEFSEGALPVDAAQALVDHHEPYQLLPWIDCEDNLILMDDGKYPQFGFGIAFSPVLVAGKDMEDQIEAMFSRAPEDTVFQFATHSSPAIDDRLAIWKNRRLRYNTRKTLEELVNVRCQFMLNAAHGKSLIKHERFFPREVKYYLFVKLAYKKDPANEREIKNFLTALTEFRGNVMGAMGAMKLAPSELSGNAVLRLCRHLCNPQVAPGELDNNQPELKKVPGAFRRSVFEKQTRFNVSGGHVSFSNDTKQVNAVPITVDDYPDTMRLFMTGELIGKVTGLDRIPNPYWLTTIAYKPPQDKAKSDIQMRFGLINKQCMTDSEWYKNMMPHLFKRRDDTAHILNQTRKEYAVVRMMTAALVFCEPERTATDPDYITGIWRKAGFRASPEKFLALPVWQTLLPWGYNAQLDLPNKGLQRGFVVSSFNAANAAICQGDWGGNGPKLKAAADGSTFPYANGLLLTARRGQMGCIDIFDSSTNYNFSVIATSGAGKSFLTNDMIVDLLCRGGLVRVIDAGGSYKKINETLGGTELRFDPTKPFSLNPYWGITDGSRFEDDEGKSEFTEMAPILKGITCQMAFPVHNPTNYEYQLVEKAIYNAFHEAGAKMGCSDVYDQLEKMGQVDEVARRIATQLHPYAYGRLAVWVNGEPQIDLSNPFTILELDELNNDKELRAVILMLIMATTTRDMYLGDRSIPKMMVVDEAWDLLSSARSGEFIETAFRRMRKYFGAAGIITQGFKDLEKSPAAEAAFDSCAWKFILEQSGPSLNYCMQESKLGRNDEFFKEMISGVHKGNGYAEVYIQNEGAGGLFRFVTDPFSYYLYTTKPQDLALIEQVSRDKGVKTLEAINLIAQQALAAS